MTKISFRSWLKSVLVVVAVFGAICAAMFSDVTFPYVIGGLILFLIIWLIRLLANFFEDDSIN